LVILAWVPGTFARFAMAGTTALGFWTELLDLPGFVVVHHEDDAPGHRHCFTLAPQREIGICPHCGKASETVKQRRNRERIADLPIGCRTVELTVRVGQFTCESCATCFTPPTDFLADSAHATERLLRRAADLIRHSDVANASRFFAIPEKNLERWYYDYLERQQQQTATVPPIPIRRIGIDELSLKKGTDSSSP
jgi:transposase